MNPETKMFLPVTETTENDEVVSIQFKCSKCGRAVPYTPVPLAEVSHAHIVDATQSKCASATCNAESGLNYKSGEGADRPEKVAALWKQLEILKPDPRLTRDQIESLRWSLEGCNLSMWFDVKRVR